MEGKKTARSVVGSNAILAHIPDIQSQREGADAPGESLTDLDVFREALASHSDEAWRLLVERFQQVVLSWVRHHTCREVACQYHDPAYYAALAFERLWQAAMRNPSLAFPSREAALRYLKASLNGAILDTVRAYTRPEIPLPEPGSPFALELAQEEGSEESELWEAIKGLIPIPRQQRVAYLLFHCGLKPRDIARWCPDEFPDVGEVHRLRRTLVERLLRQADIIRWRLSERS